MLTLAFSTYSQHDVETDPRLVAGFAKTVRVSEAIRALYEEHGPYLRATLRRLVGGSPDVEDLLQEVFIVALKRQDVLAQAISPKAWLYGIAIRVAARHREKRFGIRSFLRLDSVAEPEAAPAQSPEASAERKETQAHVYAILERISEKKRIVFILYEIQGLTGEEIAEALGCPLKTVWSRLGHARKEFFKLAAAASRKAPYGWPKAVSGGK